MNKIIGYASVSTVGQNIKAQVKQLKDAWWDQDIKYNRNVKNIKLFIEIVDWFNKIYNIILVINWEEINEKW